MTYKFDGYNWLVRLERGELLVENLLQMIREENITGAWVSGLGAAQWAEVGFYDLVTKSYSWKRMDRPFEITSLQGNVAWDGDQPALHAHITLSDAGMRAHGGHLKELEVGGTCEILLHRWYQDGLERSLDAATGLKLLNLDATKTT